MQCSVYDGGTIFSGIRYAKAVPILLGLLNGTWKGKGMDLGRANKIYVFPL